MSQRPERSKHEAAKKKPESQLPNNNTLMVIRLVVASVIFAVSLIVSMPDFLSIILLVIAAAAARGVPVHFHTPSEVKAAVTGSGRADKASVGRMVTRILGLETMPKPADAADALAVALCHAHTSRFGKLFGIG